MDQIKIKGVRLTKLNIIKNSKGNIHHILKNSDSSFIKFGEVYCSKILSNEIKAWKSHTNQTQNLCVLNGEIIVIIYDKRSNSKTYKLINRVQLNSNDKYFLLTIPPKIWYGFKCISKNEAIILNCTNIPHDSKESRRLSLDDFPIKFI